jgi:CheY-like chemotaxis protein
MDVLMPEMDGLEATRLIRQRLSVEEQPVIIAMTASVLDGDRELCFEAGMDGFLSKPVTFDKLKAALESCDSLSPRQISMVPLSRNALERDEAH